MQEELIEILGDRIATTYRVFSHDARDLSCIERIGRSSRGTPIELNRRYLESDLKVVTGLVEPHFMAGYSGGRKSVAVGLTSVKAIRHLHGTRFLEHPAARNCELIQNPLHAELTEIATTVGTDFCVNVVIDAERRMGDVFCGDIVKAHEAACNFAEQYCVINTDAPFDIVVTSAAGYPLDTTFYQAIKGLVGALGILSQGGHIVLAAECSKGLGSPEFRQVLDNLRQIGDFGRFIAHISETENFVVDQWEAEMLVKALRKGKIFLFSEGISEHDWPLTHSQRIESVEAGFSQAVANSVANPRIAVIPEGPYVIPLFEGGLA
jgi:nickel-dependent lactate racemase